MVEAAPAVVYVRPLKEEKYDLRSLSWTFAFSFSFYGCRTKL